METVPSDLYPLLYTFFKEHGLDKTAKAFKKEVQVVREMVFDTMHVCIGPRLHST